MVECLICGEGTGNKIVLRRIEDRPVVGSLEYDPNRPTEKVKVYGCEDPLCLCEMTEEDYESLK